MKLLTTFLLISTITFSFTACAASFDCGKAATETEKMVCADEGLSKLDSNLSTAYKAALEKTDNKDALKQEQKSWLKDTRNSCKEVPCLTQAYQSRIGAFNENDVPLSSTSVTSLNQDTKRLDKNKNYDDSMLYGKYSGGDHASIAIYGEITITKDDIFWSRGGCKIHYTVVDREIGERFTDMHPERDHVLPGIIYHSFKLHLEKNNCTNDTHLRVTLVEGMKNHMTLIEYSKEGSITGRLTFY